MDCVLIFITFFLKIPDCIWKRFGYIELITSIVAGDTSVEAYPFDASVFAAAFDGVYGLVFSSAFVEPVEITVLMYVGEYRHDDFVAEAVDESVFIVFLHHGETVFHSEDGVISRFCFGEHNICAVGFASSHIVEALAGEKCV